MIIEISRMRLSKFKESGFGLTNRNVLRSSLSFHIQSFRSWIVELCLASRVTYRLAKLPSQA